MKASKKQFDAYETVRKSGETNMMDVAAVIELAWSIYNTMLTREQVLDIIYNYNDYEKEYADENNDR